MAEKKALVIIAAGADISGGGEGIGKLTKKGALFTSYAAGAIFDGAVAEGDITKVDPAAAAAAIEQGTALMCCDLGNADAAALDAALATIFEAVDRKTVIAVAAKGALVLYGAGINGKAGSVARPATAKDVLPTLAYIADFPLTDACTGAILYQALKSPNLKMEELGKLKEALIRMEGALARDNREPWEKHDCA